MPAAHRIVAVLVLALTASACVAGAAVFLRRQAPGRITANLLVLAQTVIVAQLAIGLLLLADDRRAPEELHYMYGVLALAAIVSPWFYAPSEPRKRLAWFAGATLVAGVLAVRAYMTGT